MLLTCRTCGSFSNTFFTAHTIQQFQGDRGVDILPPVLAVRGHGDLPVGPLAGEMDAYAGHNGRTILQAERGQVQTTWQDTSQKATKNRNRRRENRHSVYWVWGLYSTQTNSMKTCATILLLIKKNNNKKNKQKSMLYSELSIYLLVAIKYDVWARSLLAGTTTEQRNTLKTCKLINECAKLHSHWNIKRGISQSWRVDAHLWQAECTWQHECAGGRWWFQKLQ